MAASGFFWGTDSHGGGLEVFQKVSGQEVFRHSEKVPDASAFGPRKSKANDYVPARFRLQADGSIDSLLTRPVPEHALGALSEGFGEEARRGRERRVEEAVVAANPSLNDGKLGALPVEVAARLDASAALASRAAAAAAEAAAAGAVGLRKTSLYAGVSAADPITRALTVPTSPSAGYYAVMRMMCALVRGQLVPDASGVPAGGGGALLLAAPSIDKLGPAFPELVRAEDPAYFEALEKGQKELAFSRGEHMDALRKAYAAIGDDLRYCFDRRAPPASPPRHVPLPRASGAAAPASDGDGDGASAAGSPSAPASSSRSPHSHPRVVALKETVYRSGRTHLTYSNAHSGGLHPALEMRREQGRGLVVSTGQATGNLACGVPTASAAIASAASRHPLRADAMADTLRWSLMQRVVMEQRRARCTHIVSLLEREMALEAARQTRLRRAAGKFAVAATRAAGGDWTQYASLLGTAEEQAAEEAAAAAAARPGAGSAGSASASASPPPGHARSERYAPARERSLGGSSGSEFSAADLARARFAIAVERAEATDSIVRILEAYALIPASSVAMYLASSLEDTERMAAEAGAAEPAAGGAGGAGGDGGEEAQLVTVELAGSSYAVSPAAAAKLREGRAIELLRSLQPEATAIAFELPPPLPAPPGQVINGAPAPHGVPPRTLVPPSDYFIQHGGARAYSALDEAQEDAFNANAAGGLSAFNLRPFAARTAVRRAVARTYPELEDGFKDSAEELAAAAAVAAEEAAIAKAALEAGAALLEEEAEAAARQAEEARARAAAEAAAAAAAAAEAEGGGAEGGGGGGGGGGGSSSPAQPSQARGGKGSSAAGGSGAKAVAAIRKVYPPPRKGVPEWLRALRPKPAAAGAGAGAGAGEEGGEGGEGGEGKPAAPLKMTSFDSSDFADSDAALRKWTLGGRPMWEELALNERDVSQMRESTNMQLNIVSRMRKEPPSRFSQLLGRYMPTATFKIQRQYEAALGRRPKPDNVHLRGLRSARGEAEGGGGGGEGAGH